MRKFHSKIPLSATLAQTVPYRSLQSCRTQPSPLWCTTPATPPCYAAFTAQVSRCSSGSTPAPLPPPTHRSLSLSLPRKQPAVCQGGVGFTASTVLLFQIQRTWKYPRFNLKKNAVPPAPPLPNPRPGSYHPVSRRGGELLTMFESFLVQVRVRGGFPTQTQVRVTSEPMSVVVGLGSTTIRGATEVERDKQIIRVLISSGPGVGGGNSSPPPALPPLMSP